jgi:hypothetical protein
MLLIRPSWWSAALALWIIASAGAYPVLRRKNTWRGTMATQRNRDIAKAIEIARRDAGLEPLSPYDTVDYLKTEGDIAAYLDAVREDGDPALIEAARDDVARARSRIANAASTKRGG